MLRMCVGGEGCSNLPYNLEMAPKEIMRRLRLDRTSMLFLAVTWRVYIPGHETIDDDDIADRRNVKCMLSSARPTP